MKIILCIFLLCITAVSVFGQSQELDGIVGKSIEFPAAVETSGSLIYSSKAIGYVSSGTLISLTTPKYQGRVQWDSSTGLFSLSGLRLEDSGVYTVNNTNVKTSVSFHLTVWKDNVPVSKPYLNVTRNEYRCTVLCAAARGTGATLTLYREGETNPYVTSPGHSHPHLNMTETVEGSSTYTCEAKNSVSNEKASITVGADCTAPSNFTTCTIFLNVLVIVLIALIAGLIILLNLSAAALTALTALTGFSTETIFLNVLVTVLVVALIAVLIFLLCCSAAGSSIWTILFVLVLIVILVAVLVCFYIRRKILGNKSKRPDGNKSKRPDDEDEQALSQDGNKSKRPDGSDMSDRK